MDVRAIVGVLACLSLASPAGAQERPEGEPSGPQGAADPQGGEEEGVDAPEAAEGSRDPSVSEAAAGGGGEPTEDAHLKAGPRTPPAALQTQRALRQVLARDLDGAIHTLREAIQMDPRRPEAHYYLGVTRAMQGAHKDAVASLETAARMAEDIAWEVRALVGVARIRDRAAADHPEVSDDAAPDAPRINEPALDRARSAWQRVRDLVEGQDGPELLRKAASMAAERQRVIDELLATEERTAPVRQRIADREREQAAESEPDDG